MCIQLLWARRLLRVYSGFFDTVTVPCGSTSSINFMEFLWDNTVVFSFQKYGIVCVPLDSPRVLYLRHHGSQISG